MQKLKQAILGTGVGQAALEFSRRRALLGISHTNPEMAQSIANAIIAERLVVRLCPESGTFLDVGAHIGSVLSAVRAADPSVTIFAVEAEPIKASALERKYPYCRVFGTAVGERPGKATFYLSDQSGFNSLVANAGRMIEVMVSRLDDLLPDTIVDVIKIDIEGAELGACRGAEALMSRSSPVVMFESTGIGVNSLGYSPALLWEWFDNHGYLTFTPDRLAHDAPALGLEAFLDAHEYPFRTHNYFAVPRHRRVEVRDRARAILGIRA